MPVTISPDLEAVTADGVRIRVAGRAIYRFKVVGGSMIVAANGTGIDASQRFSKERLDLLLRLQREFTDSVSDWVPRNTLAATRDGSHGRLMLERQARTGTDFGLTEAEIRVSTDIPADGRPTFALLPALIARVALVGYWPYTLRTLRGVIVPADQEPHWERGVVLEIGNDRPLIGLAGVPGQTQIEAVRIEKVTGAQLFVGAAVWVAPEQPGVRSGRAARWLLKGLLYQRP